MWKLFQVVFIVPLPVYHYGVLSSLTVHSIRHRLSSYESYHIARLPRVLPQVFINPNMFVTCCAFQFRSLGVNQVPVHLSNEGYDHWPGPVLVVRTYSVACVKFDSLVNAFQTVLSTSSLPPSTSINPSKTKFLFLLAVSTLSIFSSTFLI